MFGGGGRSLLLIHVSHKHNICASLLEPPKPKLFSNGNWFLASCNPHIASCTPIFQYVLVYNEYQTKEHNSLYLKLSCQWLG